MESLNDALDTKVQLLRTAAMLPSRIVSNSQMTFCSTSCGRRRRSADARSRCGARARGRRRRPAPSDGASGAG